VREGFSQRQKLASYQANSTRVVLDRKRVDVHDHMDAQNSPARFPQLFEVKASELARATLGPATGATGAVITHSKQTPLWHVKCVYKLESSWPGTMGNARAARLDRGGGDS
jgi:hypothetical protein